MSLHPSRGDNKQTNTYMTMINIMDKYKAESRG